MTEKTPAWYARRYVERYGMQLVPIQPKQKHPSGASAKDWGSKLLNTPEGAEAYYTEHPDWNMGVALGPSGYCSLDIDDWEAFQTILDEFGIHAEELDGYPAIQGSAKGFRLLFKQPDDCALRYAKLSWPTKEDKRKHYAIFELRAAEEGKQRLDVLPPSIHPDTEEPYRWLSQPPKAGEPWPEPPGWLLAIWDAWDKFKPQMQQACPWATPEKPKADKVSTKAPMEGVGVIQSYCSQVGLREALERYGYTRKGKSRYLSPHSDTGLPGVILFDDANTCWIHHASDPLSSEASGQPVNAFDLYCYYDHEGDVHAAVKQAAKDLGLSGSTSSAPTQQADALRADSLPDSDPPADVAATGEKDARPKAPFKALGYNQGEYFYLARGSEQVERIKRGSHTSPAEMMGLAPLEWWETAFPKGGNGGIDWQSAASTCMRLCEEMGVYSPDRERGRGAWYDGGHSVLHLGTRLLVDGEPTSIGDHKSWYIYTRQKPMENGMASDPATDAEAALVLDIFQRLNWSKPVHAQLAAGWAALGPICGALSWRPHIWLTAQRGAGKSWVQDHVIGPLLGASALRVQGSTTEAGIRQALKQDARPIVFDEAESEDQRSQSRMQTVIELARQASSDSSAEIVKGTATGGGMAFRMRSMFLLGSVNVSLTQAADQSRFTVVSLEPPAKDADEAARFEAFSKHVDSTLTDEACASIRARSYRLMPVIRENAHTFSRAVAERLGSQRLGDQIGTLMAGAASLSTSACLSLEEAREHISGLDFEDAKEAEQVSDEENCLSLIMQSQVRAEGEYGTTSRTIGELVLAAAERVHLEGMPPGAANRSVQRYGVKVDNGYIVISNTHAELRKLLKDSPWAGEWRRILSRLPEARNANTPVWFAGSKTRATILPLSVISD